MEDCLVPIKKNKIKKGKEKALKASLSSLQAACMTLAVILLESQFSPCKIKLMLVPLSDIKQLLARKCLENTAEPELKVDSTKFNRGGSLLFPAHFHLDLKDSRVFALGNQLYSSHS